MLRLCPTVTAYDAASYHEQITRLVAFADWVHIDVMDGVFAPTKSVAIADVWFPHELRADIHVMYQRPMDHINHLIKLRPHMVIIHAEADVHHMHFAAALHKHGIKAGLALLQDTTVASVERILHSFDHVLVFSGHLGYHGGEADMHLLDKVRQIKALTPEVEIGWDGGISDANASQLVGGGIDVLNIGGYIQKALHPDTAYATLKATLTQKDA